MDPQRVTWRTSTRSGNSGNCVQVAAPWHDRQVALRDSKNPGGGTLVITWDAWTAFLREVKVGQPGCRFPANLSNSQVSCPLDVQLDISRCDYQR